MDRVLDLVDQIEAAASRLHIDFGGGLGINYRGETPPAADRCGSCCWRKLDARATASASW